MSKNSNITNHDTEGRSRRAVLAAASVGLTGAAAGCLTMNSAPGDTEAELSGPSTAWSTKRAGRTRRNRVETGLSEDRTSLGFGTGKLPRPPVLGPDSVFIFSPTWRPTDGNQASGLFALSKQGGRLSWHHALEGGHTYPTIVGNTVFIQGQQLVALDRRTGDRFWAVDAPYAWWRTAPLVGDGTVVVTDGDRNAIRAVTARTGDAKWETTFDGNLRGMAADEDVYVAESRRDGSRLVRLDQESGEVIWQATGAELAGSGTPIVGANLVYLHERTRVSAYRTADGSRSWTRSIRPLVYSGVGAALGADRLFVVGRRSDSDLPADVGRLFALDRIDGAVLWTGPTVPAVEGGTPTVTADGVVVPLADDGPRLGVVDPATGRIDQSISLPNRPVTGATVGSDFAATVTSSSSASERLVRISR